MILDPRICFLAPLVALVGGGTDRDDPVPSRPPAPQMRLEVETSKNTYSEFEPVLTRVWLVNPGSVTCWIPRGRLETGRPPGRTGLRDLTAGWIGLAGSDGGALSASNRIPRRRINRRDPAWTLPTEMGFGPGRAGSGSTPIRYWRLAPGARLLLAERSFLRDRHTFTTPQGRRWKGSATLQPGLYRIRAWLRSQRLLTGEGPDPLNLTNHPGGVALEADASLRILRGHPLARRRWSRFAGITLGLSLDKVTALVGPPSSEHLQLLRFEGIGPAEIRVVRWQVPDRSALPSPHPWGRVHPPRVTAWFTGDGTRLLRLEGSLFASRLY